MKPGSYFRGRKISPLVPILSQIKPTLNPKEVAVIGIV
jgi:hypothetical protein